jgi:hypothetical protein
MTHTHHGYNDPHTDAYADTPSDAASFIEASFEAVTSDYNEDNETSDNAAEWYPTETDDDPTAANWDDDLPEDAPMLPAQRPFYRGVMALVALLVITGLLLYYIAPFLNHLLHPLPPPPLPPPWMA